MAEMSETQTKKEDGDIKAQKKLFNKYVHDAKVAEEAEKWDSALELYLSALKVFPDHPKLPNKIEKLRERLDYLKRLKPSGSGWNYDETTKSYVLLGKQPFSVSQSIFPNLFSHQKEGVAWMWNLFKKSTGGILGDDMGLGKTVQVATFLHGLFHSHLIDKALLVMPVSLMKNWEKELLKWCPRKRVLFFHGAQSAREKNLNIILEKSGIILTTYGTAQSAFETLSIDKSGEPIKWDVVVLDEGHKIKDASKKTSKAIAAIQARTKIVLSGTPIMNNLKELWALFNYACDGQLLGDMKVFRSEFEEPILRGQMKDATYFEKEKGYAVTNKLRDLISPYFLRREKSDVFAKGNNSTTLDNLENSKNGPNSPPPQIYSPSKTANDDMDDIMKDMGSLSLNSETSQKIGTKSTPNKVSKSPSSNKKASSSPKMTFTAKKNDFVCWIPLTEKQVLFYTTFLIKQRDMINDAIAKKGHALPAIQMLRKISNHPQLLRGHAEHLEGLDEILNDTKSSEEQSGKLSFTLKLLEQMKNDGHKVLLFSQSVKMLNIIEEALKEKFKCRICTGTDSQKCQHQKGLPMVRLDGSVTKFDDRQTIIDEFNNNKDIFLFMLTTQVGGVGLTLTSANRVIIFDPAWNIAMDDQAVDRAYRIGQKNNVIVYRLITCGTIEEKMYRKQVFKGALSKTLIGKKAEIHTYFTRGELRELFAFDPQDASWSHTQELLSSLHSHRRETHQELEEELAKLKTLSGFFGLSDHNLLYTEEVQTIISQNNVNDIEMLVSHASNAISKTIVPKDVVSAEQVESVSQMMNEIALQKAKSLISGSGSRVRRDPAEIGQRVGQITLLNLNDQFDLGLKKLASDPNRPKPGQQRNPFDRTRAVPKQQGGRDRVLALPKVVAASKPANTSSLPAVVKSTPHNITNTPTTTNNKISAHNTPQSTSKVVPTPLIKKPAQMPFKQETPNIQTNLVPTNKIEKQDMNSNVDAKRREEGETQGKKAANVHDDDDDLNQLLSDIQISEVVLKPNSTSNKTKERSMNKNDQNGTEKKSTEQRTEISKNVISSSSISSKSTTNNINDDKKSSSTSLTSNLPIGKVPSAASITAYRKKNIIEESDDEDDCSAQLASSISVNDDNDDDSSESINTKHAETSNSIISPTSSEIPSSSQVHESSETILKSLLSNKRMSRKSIITLDSDDDESEEEFVLDAGNYDLENNNQVDPINNNDENNDVDDNDDSNEDNYYDAEDTNSEECSEASDAEIDIEQSKDSKHMIKLTKEQQEEEDREMQEEMEAENCSQESEEYEDNHEEEEDDDDEENQVNNSFVVDDEDEISDNYDDSDQNENGEIVDFDEHDDVVSKLLQAKLSIESPQKENQPVVAVAPVQPTPSKTQTQKPVSSSVKPLPNKRRILEDDDE